MRKSGSAGYAMLAMLLVVVLASTFAVVCVGAVHAVQMVDGVDASAWRAERLGGRALQAAVLHIRWRPLELSGSVAGADPAARQSWQADWTAWPALAGVPWPRRRVRIETTASAAARREVVIVEARAEPWAVGVSCEGDVEAAALLTISGSGLYAGGCIRGRQQVRFVAEGGTVTTTGAPADQARPDSFEAAAVHSAAGIFNEGVEIHDVGSGRDYVDDTDPHAGEGPEVQWVTGPSAEWLASAAAWASPAGTAFSASTLHLDALPAPTTDEVVNGRCVVVSSDEEVTVEGTPHPGAGPLLIVVQGDAVVGQPGESVRLCGGLVVTGRLRLRGEVEVLGPLHAGSLVVSAPSVVSVPSDWRSHPLPGAARPVVVETGS